MLQKIYGDSRRMKQILINFISNSLKFTPSNGKITIMIRINEEPVDQDEEIPKSKSIYGIEKLKNLNAEFNKEKMILRRKV